MFLATFKRFSLIIITLVNFYSYAEENDPNHFELCTGSGLENDWRETTNRLLTEAFNKHGLELTILSMPSARAEYQFQQKRCDFFLASARHFNQRINRDDIFYVDVEVMRARLALYAAADHQPAELPLSSFMTLDKFKNNIGYFATLSLQDFMRSFAKAHHTPYLDIERGFRMLDKGWVNYLIVPEVASHTRDHYKAVKDRHTRLLTIADLGLYLWFDNKHLSQKQQLTELVTELAASDEWRRMFILSEGAKNEYPQ